MSSLALEAVLPGDFDPFASMWLIDGSRPVPGVLGVVLSWKDVSKNAISYNWNYLKSLITPLRGTRGNQFGKCQRL